MSNPDCDHENVVDFKTGSQLRHLHRFKFQNLRIELQFYPCGLLFKPMDRDDLSLKCIVVDLVNFYSFIIRVSWDLPSLGAIENVPNK